MAKKKTLQELTIKDNFLFGAVMVNEENCKEVPDIQLPDGRQIIYLSTCGKNPAEVLKSWFQTALRAGSIEAFEEAIQSR